MARLFGTDGVRGLAGADLTAELALAVAEAAVAVLAERRPAGDGRPHVIVGRDTRPSGEFLEAAVVAGLASAGADVRRLGVVPTPTVAFAVADSGADLGVVLSASHNPMPDNGIKLFGAGGRKLPDAVEDLVEATYRTAQTGRSPRRTTGADVGRVTDDPGLVGRYADHLLAALPAPLDGLRVVVDCAEGAASALAPEVLRKAGADVVAIHADGDGLRINAGCGATSTAALQQVVVAERADVGLAFDGDADRCLAVDAAGALVDGDQILAMCAVSLRDRGQLAGGTVVSTVMANLGFRHAMRAAGIEVVETPVGDRYVLEAMVERGLVLGGEQSGHVIFADHATTGDGLLTGLQVLGHVAATGRPLADLAAVMTRLPQVLINVPVADKSRAATSARLTAAVDTAVAALGEEGRVLLRPSGTEQLVRVMVEATTPDRAAAIAEHLADEVRLALT